MLLKDNWFGVYWVEQLKIPVKNPFSNSEKNLEKPTPIWKRIGGLDLDPQGYQFFFKKKNQMPTHFPELDFSFIHQQSKGKLGFNWHSTEFPTQAIYNLRPNEILATLHFKCESPHQHYRNEMLLRIDKSLHSLYLHAVESTIETWRIYRSLI